MTSPAHSALSCHNSENLAAVVTLVVVSQMRDSDIPDDAFTTEKMEEANLVMGPQSSLSTAWRVNEHLQELAYTQLW